MEQLGHLAFQFAMGVSLAACAGLRAFLPLLVVSVAGKLGWIPLAERFDWIGTWPAITVFGVAVITEILADKLPVVDNVLDVLQSWLKPVAGALVVMAALSEMSPLEATVVGLIAGASTAGVVHFAKAKARLMSSVVTGGLGNPVLSLAEDVAALTGSILSLVVPFILATAVIATLVLVYLAFRRFRLRSAAGAG